MRVSLFSTAVLLLTLIAGGATALACDCLTPPAPKRFESSDIVFEGEVVLVLHRKEYPQFPIGYVFHVSKTLKGKPVKEVTILGGGWDCDAQFTLNGVYRVYAYERDDGKFSSGSCSGNEYLYFNPPRYLAAHTTSESIWHSWYVKGLIISAFVALLASLLYA
jgi:hypothetical protein